MSANMLSMRMLGAVCVGAAIAASGAVRAQDGAAAAQEPARAAAQDAAAFDPFAASEALQASGQQRATPPQATATTTTTAATPALGQQAGAQSDRAPAKAPSRLNKSLDLLYQGSYLPGLISAGGRDQAEQDVIVDAGIDWAMSDGAALGARLVAKHAQRKAGSASSHRNDLTALEYYYGRQFAGGTQALTIGRKVVDWSSGFQWRPANLIDNGFSSKNTDIQDPYRYRGVNQVRYGLIQPGFDVVAIVSNERRNFFGGEQFAAKLSIKSAVDFSLMYAANGDYSRKYGAIVDAGLPWGMTLALEAVHVDVNRSKLADAAHFGRTLESLSGIRRYEDVYLSLTKFIDEKRRVGVEYFHNGRGLDDASGRSLAGNIAAAAAAAAAAGAAQPVIDTSIFSKQYLGRNYVYAAYTGYLDAWSLQLKPSVMVNTGDNSSTESISVKRELGDSSELTLNLNTFHGRAGSEFGSVTNGVGVSVSYIFHFF